MKLLKKTFLYLLIASASLGVFLFGLWSFNGPDGLADASSSSLWLDKRPYEVAKVSIEVVDAKRVTPALGKYKGSNSRQLNGAIWFPKGQAAKVPLIVYSHGFGGYHKDSTHLTEFLASNGYIVAAVDFPLSYARSPAGVPQLEDVVNQPADVSAVVDHLLKLHDDPDSALYNRVDAENIGAMGLSLGGLTTALISFHPDLIDHRIKASVMMAPPLEAFDKRFFGTNANIDSLLISGSMDRVVPERMNASDVRSRHPNGWFLSLDKGTHLGFADVGNTLRWMENPDNLGCAFMAYMLGRLELPEKWDSVIPNTGGILRDISVNEPCPDLPGKSMNGLKQQWLTQLSIRAFFDMHLLSGKQALTAKDFLTGAFISENPELNLTTPLLLN